MSDGNNDHSAEYKQNQIIWAKNSGEDGCPGMINLQQSQMKPEFFSKDLLIDSPQNHLCSKQDLNLPTSKRLKYQLLNQNVSSNKNSFEVQNGKTTFEQNNIHFIKPSIKNSLHINQIDNQNATLPYSHQIAQVQKDSTSPTTNKQNIHSLMVDSFYHESFENHQNSSNFQKQEQQIQRSTKKRGRKPKAMQKSLESERRELQQQNKMYKQSRNMQVKELLRKYHLQNIPKAALEKKQVNLSPLICRKIYRILKMNGYNLRQGHTRALKLRDKINKIEDLMKMADLPEISKTIEEEEI